MKKLLALLIALLSVLIILSACGPDTTEPANDDDDSTPPPQDGMVTIYMDNIQLGDGIYGYWAIYDPAIAVPASTNMEAAGSFILSNGIASNTANWPGDTNLYIGAGGSSWKLYAWIDMNSNMGGVQYPEPGIDLRIMPHPMDVMIDGNTLVDVPATNLALADGLSVYLTGSGSANGHKLYYGIYSNGTPPNGTNNMFAMGDIDCGPGLQTDIPNDANEPGLWAEEEGSYDVYMWIDMNDNMPGVMYPETNVDRQHSTFPITIDKLGSYIIVVDYSDFILVP